MIVAILLAVLAVVLFVVLCCLSETLDSHRNGPLIGFSMVFVILGLLTASGVTLYWKWGVW